MQNDYKKERRKESAPWREVERLALFDSSRKVTCNKFDKYSKTNNKYKTSLERLKCISNIRTNWQTVQIPRCSLRFLLNAPMSAASTVSVGRLFHSFTILIKKEVLETIDSRWFDVQFEPMIWSGTRKFGKFEIVTKIYIFAESEDYFVALYQAKIVATYGKRWPVEQFTSIFVGHFSLPLV